jgi:creatinine amidohydrolase
VETSIMMHLHPDLVRREELANFRPRSLDMEGDYEILTPEGSIAFGWETQDLSPPGACDDATDADAERGAQLVEHAAARFVKLLAEIDRYPLDALRAGPLHKK